MRFAHAKCRRSYRARRYSPRIRRNIYPGGFHGSRLDDCAPGTAAKWIRYQAYPEQHPLISFNGRGGVTVESTAAYIELGGFTITGNNDHVTLQEAQRQGQTPNPAYNGNCKIARGNADANLTQNPHHRRIVNNVIGKCGGGGIATMNSDYVTIWDDIVYDSAWYSIYGNSGISTYEDWNSDNYTGYKMFIADNRVFWQS
ncbi:MAG: hypothetical protein WA419_14505 [Silvibacterium sp.]